MQILLVSWNCENKNPKLNGEPGFDFNTLLSLNSDSMWKKGNDVNPDIIILSLQESGTDSINDVFMGSDNPIKNNYDCLYKNFSRGMTKGTINCLRIIIYARKNMNGHVKCDSKIEEVSRSKGCLGSIIKIKYKQELERRIGVLSCHLESKELKQAEQQLSKGLESLKGKLLNFNEKLDEIFIMGDLNYRLNIKKEEEMKAINPINVEGINEQWDIERNVGFIDKLAEYDSFPPLLNNKEWNVPLPKLSYDGSNCNVKSYKDLQLDIIDVCDWTNEDEIILPPTYPIKYEQKWDIINHEKFLYRPSFSNFCDTYGKDKANFNNMNINSERNCFDIGWLDRIAYTNNRANKSAIFFANYNLILSDHVPVLMIYQNADMAINELTEHEFCTSEVSSPTQSLNQSFLNQSFKNKL